jgi:hypothetical protein
MRSTEAVTSERFFAGKFAYDQICFLNASKAAAGSLLTFKMAGLNDNFIARLL